MKIDILVGHNTYNTTLHFSKALSEAFTSLGDSVRLFWIADGHFFHAFYDILNDPPDFTLSFSDIHLENKALADLWQIPHLFFTVDPPIYFLHHLKSQYGWLSCVDKKDCAFVEALNYPRVFFLPHGASVEQKTPVNTPRPYEAVFFGTCIDYEAISATWPREDKELLLTASDLVLSAKGLSIVEALVQLGVNSSDLPRLHHELDLYTRGKDRIQLIRSLKGHRVHIWGSGPWKKFFPEHQILPEEDFDHILAIMKQSKIVLNSSPRFKEGAHERIFYALMCGACVYTGENAYISQELPELFTYRFGEWDTPCFAESTSRAESGQCKVLKGHTWNARAEEIKKACVNYR